MRPSGIYVLLALLFSLSAASVFAVFAAPSVYAQVRPVSSPAPGRWQTGGSPTNAECLACHSDPNLKRDLPSGEPLSLYVDKSHYASSVHGGKNVTCAQCHSNITGFPHPDFSPTDRRDVTIKLYPLCRQCHADNFLKTQDSVHASALASGNRNAAVCTDCHTAHEVTPPDQPRTRIPQTCAQCHSTIFAQYVDSVHGTGLTNGGSADVPTCIDCHGVHNIGDPTSAAFRLKSPQLCAKCHTDSSRMAKYNISTNVLNTYVADFHGTTVELFAKESPDAATNKPVCFDCHGIHDIKKVDDPSSSVFKENLLKTCQKCHPNATVGSFAGAWMSHYIASPEKYPLVYYINLFYWILIPATIGGMLLYIAVEVYGRFRTRARKQLSSQNVAIGEENQSGP